MKVKFLRSGIEAHSESKRGNFVFKEGEEMSGLSEATALQMKSDGNAEIISDDASEIEDEEVETEDEENDDEEKPKSKMPWSK
jgi:hypothetical protein